MHRRGTVEFLASMMTVVEGETIAMNDHAWEVITMMSVAKSLRLDVLNNVGDLLFDVYVLLKMCGEVLCPLGTY
jgi:hypothetical protein